MTNKNRLHSSPLQLFEEASRMKDKTLLKKGVQMLIEKNQIQKLSAMSPHLQRVFLRTLEDLLISAIHHHHEKRFHQMIHRMKTIKHYSNFIDYYHDVIPLHHFAAALADEHHESFLNLIRTKHLLDDNYLIFLAFKTENMHLLYQLDKIGVDLKNQIATLTLIQADIIASQSEPQKAFIQFLLTKEIEQQEKNFPIKNDR